MACIDLHQTGSVGAGSDHLQLIKFWPSCAPGKVVCGGAKFFGSALLRQARSVCVSPSGFFIETCDSYGHNHICYICDSVRQFSTEMFTKKILTFWPLPTLTLGQGYLTSNRLSSGRHTVENITSLAEVGLISIPGSMCWGAEPVQPHVFLYMPPVLVFMTEFSKHFAEILFSGPAWEKLTATRRHPASYAFVKNGASTA